MEGVFLRIEFQFPEYLNFIRIQPVNIPNQHIQQKAYHENFHESDNCIWCNKSY